MQALGYARRPPGRLARPASPDATALRRRRGSVGRERGNSRRYLMQPGPWLAECDRRRPVPRKHDHVVAVSVEQYPLAVARERPTGSARHDRLGGSSPRTNQSPHDASVCSPRTTSSTGRSDSNRAPASPVGPVRRVARYPTMASAASSAQNRARNPAHSITERQAEPSASTTQADCRDHGRSSKHPTGVSTLGFVVGQPPRHGALILPALA